MKRPEDAPLFLAEVSAQLVALDGLSDVMALGYLKTIYHIAATYGLEEAHGAIQAALNRILDRYNKNDPVKLHYLICSLSGLPAAYSKRIISELEEFVDRLNMPEITRVRLSLLKKNLEGRAQGSE